MRNKLGLVVLGFGLFGLACTGGDAENADNACNSDNAENADNADNACNSDNADNACNACGGDTGYGEDFDEEDPSFTVQIDGSAWSTGEGQWFSNNLSANIPDASESQNLNISVDGQLKFAGTYAVESISYSLTPSQSTPVIYSADDPDITVTVLGFSGDNEYLFATIDGSAELSDGTNTVSFSGGEVRNWYPF